MRGIEGQGAPVALLIDAENCPGAQFERAVAQARAIAPVTIARAFADWTRPHLKETGRGLVRLGIEGRHHPAAPGGRNGSDIALAVDAMELLHTVRPRCFVIVSRDADFSPLAIKLRAAGCEVIGIGAGPVAAGLEDACTRYVMLDTAAETQAVPPPAAPMLESVAANDPAVARETIADWLAVYLHAYTGDDPWHRLADLGKLAAGQPGLDYKPGGGRLHRIVKADDRFAVRTDASKIILVALAPLAVPVRA